jgi:phosphatidylserine/phosphatidylglycerophosphate/cardiolipin synthase-like enzyme
MHHKFCIIDNKVIISGSYNWTFRARNHNSENIVLIENEDAIKIFDEVFKSLWNQSIAYDFQKSYIKENEHDIDIDYSLESKYETEINNRTEEVKKLKIGIDINLIYGLINKRSARIAAITLTRNGNNIKIQSGFQKLWKEKKLYLSLEESIINSDFIQLFEKIDIARAYKKLKSMNYFDSEEYQKLMQRYDLENLSKIYEDMKTKV